MAAKAKATVTASDKPAVKVGDYVTGKYGQHIEITGVCVRTFKAPAGEFIDVLDGETRDETWQCRADETTVHADTGLDGYVMRWVKHVRERIAATGSWRNNTTIR